MTYGGFIITYVVIGKFVFLLGVKISLSTVSSGEKKASVAGIATKTERAHTLMKNWNTLNSSKIGGESDETAI